MYNFSKFFNKQQNAASLTHAHEHMGSSDTNTNGRCVLLKNKTGYPPSLIMQYIANIFCNLQTVHINIFNIQSYIVSLMDDLLLVMHVCGLCFMKFLKNPEL